jgi:hypothetical protein
MVRSKSAGFIVALIAGALVACSGESPVAPKHVVAPQPVSARPGSQSTPGIYQLSFFTNGLLPVTTLPAGSSELILGAHVTDAAGTPVQSGSVTFQYCSLKRRPPNDISRADEAPSSECASGAASWARLITIPVNASGDAYMDFGFVQIPRTVGFRFSYSGKGGGVASGQSSPRDFTWVAP